MRHTSFLVFVFVASATVGYSYVFRTDKVHLAMARLCYKHRFLDFVMGKWLVESPHCIFTLKLMGVLDWVIACHSLLCAVEPFDELNTQRYAVRLGASTVAVLPAANTAVVRTCTAPVAGTLRAVVT